MEPRCGMAEIQFLGDRQEIPQVAKIDIMIHMKNVLIRINNILDVLIGLV